jgi:hypothetical protein
MNSRPQVSTFAGNFQRLFFQLPPIRIFSRNDGIAKLLLLLAFSSSLHLTKQWVIL